MPAQEPMLFPRSDPKLTQGPYVTSAELKAAPPPPARRLGPQTSKDAARSKRRDAPTEAKRVWRLIRAAGGLTCDEVEVQTGMLHQSASARIRTLAKAGYLRDSKVKRRTRTGRGAIVWMVVAPGPL